MADQWARRPATGDAVVDSLGAVLGAGESTAFGPAAAVTGAVVSRVGSAAVTQRWRLRMGRDR